MEDLEIVYNALQQAKRYGLESEVVLYALKSMKKNSELSIEEAVRIGLLEWVK